MCAHAHARMRLVPGPRGSARGQTCVCAEHLHEAGASHSVSQDRRTHVTRGRWDLAVDRLSGSASKAHAKAMFQNPARTQVACTARISHTS